MKTTTIGAFLTPEEIRLCHTLRSFVPRHEFAATVTKEVIEPVLPRINAALGQENDLGYMVEAVFNEAERSA